ncbi:MAG: hypothetical protein HKN79_07845, partial [Flavobacteriales bacterium]|nr:hypothetical protein [Flavobacteriales bacterium]
TCAYDPNDKLGRPLGYTDAHYILQGQEIEYRIRFQNTGNAPATVVFLTDSIDMQLDLSSFTLEHSTHCVNTVIDPISRIVTFYFDDIQLPDSVSDPLGSQGHVVFTLQQNEGLLPGDTIRNQGKIFFDNNPPIITNETWHTIFDCDWMTIDYDNETRQICPGELLEIPAEFEFAETVIWTIADTSIYAESLALEMNTPGWYLAQVNYSNPYCSQQRTVQVNVVEPIDAVLYGDSVFCSGDSVFLNSNASFYDHVWYLDGDSISSENNITIHQGGEYELVIYNQGCPSPPIAQWIEEIITPSAPDILHSSSSFCEGDSLELSVSTTYDLAWLFENEVIDSLSLIYAGQAGDYGLVHWDRTCYSDTTYLTVEMIELPTSPSLPSDSVFICEGDSITITAVSDYDVEWYFESETMGSAASQTLDTEGSYSVIAISEICTSVPNSIEVVTHPYPQLPVIDYVTGELITYLEAGLSYQWYLDGEAIPGAVTHVIEPIGGGDYTVLVENELGCSISSGIYFLPVSLTEWDSEVVVLFPNPFTERAVLRIPASIRPVTFEIFDSSGHLLRAERHHAHHGELIIERRNLASGQYTLKISGKAFEQSIQMLVH